MAIAIALLALVVAIYAAVVARNARTALNSFDDAAEAFRSVAVHQPPDSRFRTLDD